ncbi:MAG: 23S rRNA (uracil(1939)-C(5))-methyltransferase RlmD [Clostridia bacterium]|nr:23S rRNA (uracil(1939)-C(5))-methyltransferase RlmD [Clostridia bacterium]
MVLTTGAEIEIDIQGFASSGSGVGRLDGLAVFVPGALPGERVLALITRLRGKFAEARLLSIVRESAERTQPPCPVFGRCGGCAMQQADYNFQLKLKRGFVYDTLRRIAKIDTAVSETIASPEPYHYRHRMHYHAAWVKGKLHLGFFIQRSRILVEAAACLLAAPPISSLAQVLPDMLAPFRGELVDLRGVVLRCNSSGEQMSLILLVNTPIMRGRELARQLQGAVSNLTEVWECAGAPRNGTYGGHWQLLAGQSYLSEQLCGREFRLSPAAFTQVNPAVAERLYQLVGSYAALTGAETVLDLYSGAGAIALLLAGRAAQVIGVESFEPAVADAERAAKLNGADNCRFICGAVELVLPRLAEQGVVVDVAVLDPPRAGCDAAALEALLMLQPRRIIYVSCDPATLARDLRRLAEGGYQVGAVQPLDMFPQTGHVECVVLITKL